MATDTKARLKARYREEIVPGLQSEFGYSNVMQVPTVTKVVVNMGVGEAARDSKLIEGAIRDLTEITGQKPQITKARKSIAQFKLREGQPIGAQFDQRLGRHGESVEGQSADCISFGPTEKHADYSLPGWVPDRAATITAGGFGGTQLQDLTIILLYQA